MSPISAAFVILGLGVATLTAAHVQGSARQRVEGAGALNESFVYTADAHAQLQANQPLAAAVLFNISGQLAHPVASGCAQGKSSVDGKGDFGYKVRVTATSVRMVMEFVFEGLGTGPALEPVRVDIDSAGNATATSLAASETKTIAERLQTSCAWTEPINQRADHSTRDSLRPRASANDTRP